MRVLKGISLFFIYPALMLLFGFVGGICAVHYFYPGTGLGYSYPEQAKQSDWNRMDPTSERSASEKYEWEGGEPENGLPEVVVPEETREVVAREEKLSTDTQYVLEETDMLRGTVVETVWKLPAKYVGMNREQFVEAMAIYGNFPPLSEMEKGFVNLEVLSFSRERVVVQMNYRYVQPGTGYYLAVQDNDVIVYLEDGETVYLDTGIRVDELPEDLQLQIMDMLYMEDEEQLYNFLEDYSS